MRVLLFSPVRHRDPASGDIGYTENLLMSPPSGVAYTTYAEAIEDGLLQVRGVRGTVGVSDRLLKAGRGLEVLARRRGVMFREPCWFVSTTPGAFDLVHQHLFAVAQIGVHLPVFSSAGYPLDVRYLDHDGWSPTRTRVAISLERGLNRVGRVHNPWLNHVQPAISSGYTEEFRRQLVRRGVPESQSLVLSTYLAAGSPPRTISDGRTLAFVGRDFERKGGPTALAAFAVLHRADPRLRLHVVTSAADGQAIEETTGVLVHGELPHHEVLSLLARTDVLLAPTGSDCGAPYGVLEALRAGCSVVLALNRWLDERLQPPVVIRVAPTVSDVASAATALLERRHRDHEMTVSEARDLWRTHFSEATFLDQLLAGYTAALQLR